MPAANTTSRRLRERALLLSLCVGALLGLAFTSGSEGAFQRVLGRTVGLPSEDVVSVDRQLGTPAEDEDIPVALAATGQVTASEASGAATAARADVVAQAVTDVAAAEPTPSSAAPAAEDSQVAAARTAPAATPAAPTTTTTAAPRTPTTAAPTTTTAPRSAPTTTAAPRTTTTTTTTTAAPAAPPAAPPGGWVSPAATGHRRSNLHQFPAANDGPHGVTIDQSFLDAHSSAAWLTYENGRPVISGANATGRCLNILVTLTLRDSVVDCPTRVQNDSWGFAGITDDAPAVNVLGAQNVLIEYNTIRCTGFDGDLCSSSVRLGGRDATVQYNDLSFARSAVSMFHGAVFRFNYAHDFAFGFDPKRAGNPSDNITHNNAVNNLGYSNTLVQGNYIVARYGRVSAQPGTYLNPHYHTIYSGGVVDVGDPINGFTFTNYLIQGNGSGMRIVENYVVAAGRPFRCNASSSHSGPSCAADISGNVFVDDYFDGFGATLFHDKDGNGSIAGSCNLRGAGGSYSVLPSSSFGSAGTHGTNC